MAEKGAGAGVGILRYYKIERAWPRDKTSPHWTGPGIILGGAGGILIFL